MTTFAIPNLYAAVKARFTLDSTQVVNLFGWRTPDQRIVQGARICWLPGDDESGDAGALAPAKYPGGYPRSLGTLRELFTLIILVSDQGNPENELAQYNATRLVFDAWYRAAYLAAYGTFEVQDVSWLNGVKDRRYGAGMRVLVAIDSMIPDSTPLGPTYVDANTGVDVETDFTTTLAGVSEIDTVAGEPDE